MIVDVERNNDIFSQPDNEASVYKTEISESALLSRLSPIMKYFPSGTVTGPNDRIALI